MLTFEPFRIWLVKTKKGRVAVREECGFSSSTFAKIMNDSFPIRSDTIETLCETYNLKINEVIEFRSSKPKPTEE